MTNSVWAISRFVAAVAAGSTTRRSLGVRESKVVGEGVAVLIYERAV